MPTSKIQVQDVHLPARWTAFDIWQGTEPSEFRVCGGVCVHVCVRKIALLSEGTEVAIFYAQVQAGTRGGGGSIWLYNTSYVLTLGKTFLPGNPIEEVHLRGKA